MAGLSNIFGGDHHGSSDDGAPNTDTPADTSDALGQDEDSEQNETLAHDDGPSGSTYHADSLPHDAGTDSLLGNVTDAAGMTDESSH